MSQSARYTRADNATVEFIRADGTVVHGAAPFSAGDVCEEFDAFIAAGGVVSAYVAPLPTIDNVIAERERRLALGFNYDFGDARGVHRFGTTARDLAGWDEVTQLAAARLAKGETTPVDVVTNTGPANVTPLEWQDVLLAAGAFRQPIWAASFGLEAQNPIPADYADDAHWPPV